MKKEIKIDNSWKIVLKDEFEKEYFQKLTEFVRNEYLNFPNKVFPPAKKIFNAFNLCPFDKIKVVIIGQDPYHGENQANGLSFAVSENIAIPPSLRNIFIEIKNDLGIDPLPSGDLSRWAKQGVLLLNATLTVRANTPQSHQNKGWEVFTDSVIRKIAEQKKEIVYILWGNYARKKKSMINTSENLVIESSHPSPFSAYNGFFNSKPFSKTNTYLKKNNLGEVDWR